MQPSRSYVGYAPRIVSDGGDDPIWSGEPVSVSAAAASAQRPLGLAQLDVSVDARLPSHAALHQLAHETMGGRRIAVGRGGYGIVQVLRRSWTHLLPEITDHPLDPDTTTPDIWLELVFRRTGREGPKRLTDGTAPAYHPWDAGAGDADDPGDHAFAATSHSAFPDHGLDHIDPR
jgi:acetoin utilization protein AcuC